jgi:hypothetical protein
LAIWWKWRGMSLKAERLVKNIDKVESEMYSLLVIKHFIDGVLTPAQINRLKLLDKRRTWLKRIYKGLWPWRVKNAPIHS